MDIGIFDNFDDDGQMTLFGLEEDFGELPEPLGQLESEGDEVQEDVRDHFGISEGKKGSARRGARNMIEEPEPEKESVRGAGQDTGIRIRRCSSCGKLLFVREEGGSYYSSCNACGIQYAQK